MSQEDMRLSGGTATDSKKKYVCKDFYGICMNFHTLTLETNKEKE
jgi:hypothetical protein